MSIMSKIKQFAQNNIKALGVSAAVVVMAGLGAAVIGGASASPVSTPNCDANAVVWCGASSSSGVLNAYNNGDGHNKANTIQAIYAGFGIDRSDVESMSSDSQTGYVTKSGDVYVGSKEVAKNAMTAGRENIAGSTKESYGPQVYYERPPSVSFVDDELTAMVVMKNGVFQFAILVSCGNPVKATPVTPPPAPKPATLTCNELDLTPGSVESNGDQNYALEAQATPANGAAISNYAFNFGDGSSKTVSTSSDSTSTTHTYAPGTYTVTVTVTGTASGKTITAPATTSCEKTITVKKPSTPTPPPTPAPTSGSLVCDELTLTAGQADASGNVSYTLEASATKSASEATISGYTFNFGDSSQSNTLSSSASSVSTTHTYAPGNWTASVTVNGTVNGKSVTETSVNCSAPVKVGQLPVSPVYVCSGLTMSPAGNADSAGNVSYNLTATASASNATISSYSFNYGDNSQADVVQTADTSANATHAYAPGTYTAQVTVTFTLANGTTETATADSCQAKVTIAAPTCTSTTGQTYPAGSNECQTCTSPSGQTYPVGSAQCTPTTTTTTPTPPSTPTPTTTTSLPNTGPGDVVGLFSGVSMSGAGIHRIMGNRRARRAATRR
jgi:hypothetical protein